MTTNPANLTTPQLSSVGRRVLAFLVDASLCLFCQFVSLFFAAWLSSRGLGWNGFWLVTGALGFLAPISYIAWANAGGRQSLGARSAGIRFEGTDSNPISLPRSLVRVTVTYICASSCWLWVVFVPVVFRGRRTLPDYLTNARAIQTGAVNRVPAFSTIILGFALLLGTAGAIVTGQFPLQAFFVASGSMEPTLNIFDRVLCNRLAYRGRQPQVGDILLFNRPETSEGSQGRTSIMRCVGTAGNIVELRKSTLFRNGAPVDEPFIQVTKSLTSSQFDGAPMDIGVYDTKIISGRVFTRSYVEGTPGPWTENDLIVPEIQQSWVEKSRSTPIPSGMLLVLGDNRGNSNDSRFWGLLTNRRVIGRAIGTYWPPSRWGAL